MNADTTLEQTKIPSSFCWIFYIASTGTVIVLSMEATRSTPIAKSFVPQKLQILQLGGEEVLRAVKLLTKQKGYTMSEYMQGILENPIAKAVKIADRTHNVLCLKDADEAFRERYLKETKQWYIGLSEKIANAVKIVENGGEK